MLIKDTDFYWPWPLLEGVPLNEQWYRIRKDTELLYPIVFSTYYENTDDIHGNGHLAGFEFGSQSFSNQYRVVYLDPVAELHFQCNDGDLYTPNWHSLFHLDCDNPNQIQFDGNVFFNAGFYPLPRVSFRDGVHNFVDSAVIFSRDFFYLTKDSQGHPVVNPKFTGITFTDGTGAFYDDTVNFNGDQFYIQSSTDGEPVINITGFDIKDEIDLFIKGLVTEGDWTVKERSNHDFFIDKLTGRTSKGSVSVKGKINNTTIPEISELWFYPVPRTYNIPSRAVIEGDRIRFYLSNDPQVAAADFALAIGTRRQFFA